MGIFHEMPPADLALACTQCLEDVNWIDFDSLGYTPKLIRNGSPLCVSCHEEEEPLNFYKLHEKHVENKGYACAECHDFTR
jgi:hypothetical protein